MVTIKDVAKRARVSPSTVSNILNNTKPVRGETRDRVLDAIRRLDYRPNPAARNLRAKRTEAIGVVVPSISNPFYPSIVRGIEDFSDNREKTIRRKPIFVLCWCRRRRHGSLMKIYPRQKFQAKSL